MGLVVELQRELHNAGDEGEQIHTGILKTQSGRQGIQRQNAYPQRECQAEASLAVGQEHQHHTEGPLQHHIEHSNVRQIEKQQQRLQKQQIPVPVAAVGNGFSVSGTVNIVYEGLTGIELGFWIDHSLVQHGVLQRVPAAFKYGGLHHNVVGVSVQPGAGIAGGPAEAAALRIDGRNALGYLGLHPAGGQGVDAGHQKTADQYGDQQASGTGQQNTRGFLCLQKDQSLSVGHLIETVYHRNRWVSRRKAENLKEPPYFLRTAVSTQPK